MFQNEYLKPLKYHHQWFFFFFNITGLLATYSFPDNELPPLLINKKRCSMLGSFTVSYGRIILSRNNNRTTVLVWRWRSSLDIIHEDIHCSCSPSVIPYCCLSFTQLYLFYHLRFRIWKVVGQQKRKLAHTCQAFEQPFLCPLSTADLSLSFPSPSYHSPFFYFIGRLFAWLTSAFLRLRGFFIRGFRHLSEMAAAPLAGLLSWWISWRKEMISLEWVNNGGVVSDRGFFFLLLLSWVK